MFSDNILPVISLIIGFFLSELSYLFRARRENRKEIGLVVSLLLEIRHRLKGLRSGLDEIKKIVPLNPEIEIQISVIIENIFPQPEDFNKKFNESINVISKFNPLLGFRLRSKEQFIPFLQAIRNMVMTNDFTIKLFNELDNLLSEKYIKIIDEMLIELAKVHSIKTWYQTKNYIEKQYNLAKEFEDIFTIINKYKK